MLNPVNTTGNRENLHSAEWKIFYTTDGSYPDRTAQSYTSPFLISCSTIIRAALYRNGSRLCDAESFFRKGKREKIIDLTHGNRELNSDRPAGPFAEQLTGEWLDEKYRYRFTSTGEFIRDVGADLRQLLGYWWYDFPADIFEAQDYTGTGEIWFSSGEKCPMALVTQEAEELVIQTGGAVGTAYESPDTLILKRKCRGGTHEE
jgi:beta-galactosidase